MLILNFLYKIFIECVHRLLIAPRIDETVNWPSYGKTFIFMAVQTWFFIWEYIESTLWIEPLGNLKYIIYSYIFIGYILTLLVYKTYLKGNSWQRLYKDIDLTLILNNSKEIKAFAYNSNIGKITLKFFISNLIMFYLICKNFPYCPDDSKTEVRTIIRTIGSIAASWINYYYVLVLIAFIETLLAQINAELIEAKTCIFLIPSNNSNLKKSKNIFFKVQRATKLICNLFGHQILLIFAQWILTLVLICSALFLISGITNENWQMILAMVNHLILTSFGPCAIAFTCDMVTAEVNKLLQACYEVQENFDCNSYEYQELNSFGSYIASTGIRFTAADFFGIKRSTLLTVIATSTTYFIALVQFY